MKNIKEIRETIKKIVVNRLSVLSEICSITFVGSFVHKDDISVISDIDIIVIVNNLKENVFNEIRSCAASITASDCKLPSYHVKLNMSFGPLKFNDAKTLVFHLMVYDRKSHRRHVIDSPFTCNDWQYEKAVYGLDLLEIYPANALQLDDIIGSRRGLDSYIDDLKKGVITYRNYVFNNEGVCEEKSTYQMDDRHRKEYAYHILKFLMLNLLKILRQENIKYTDNKLAETFLTLDCGFENSIRLFQELSEWKYRNGPEPKNIFEQAEEFIEILGIWFYKTKESLPRVIFMRHAKTILNDGSFLGIGRDPEILPVDSELIPSQQFDTVYTGNLERTVATGRLLKGNTYIQNNLLNEINYGLAEGLLIDELNKQFPYMSKQWQKKQDPRFPGGENQLDVAKRLNEFINNVIVNSSDKNTAVVTHNIVLRALLGRLYQAEVYDWFRFCPSHIEEITFCIFKGVLISELKPAQRIKFRDQMMQWS